MSREVRRVPPDWRHPLDEEQRTRRDGTPCYRPLFDGTQYAPRLADWLATLTEKGMQATLEWCGNPPNQDDYMPVWTPEQATHLMMYETCSEGTPISPAFATPEELARWCADNGASAFGSMTASYEGWLAVARGRASVGMVMSAEGCVSGVDLLVTVKP